MAGPWLNMECFWQSYHHKPNGMKKTCFIFALCAFVYSGVFSQDNDYYNDNTAYANNNTPGYVPESDNYDSQDNDGFYDELSPYGNWINYPGYGNVWMPASVSADFAPYATAGHWVYTDYGWSWQSDYAWGDVVFHYGRWFRDNTYGWLWMPGTEWAPAWVSWGSYDNYYCWAPLAPFASYTSYYRPNPYCWNFISRDRFCERDLEPYLANRSFYGREDYRNIGVRINIINDAHVYGNRSYYAGPRANEVEKFAGHRIEPVAVNHINVNRTVVVHNNANPYHSQVNTYNRGNVQADHNYNNNRQQQYNQSQNNRNNNQPQYQRPAGQNTIQQYQRNSVQPQRQVQQSYNQPYRQPENRPAYQPQQRGYASQPVQRQSTQNFASPARPSNSFAYSPHTAIAGGHGGRR